jgi:hypothetical protein
MFKVGDQVKAIPWERAVKTPYYNPAENTVYNIPQEYWPCEIGTIIRDHKSLYVEFPETEWELYPELLEPAQPTINECLINQNKLDFDGLVKVLEQAQVKLGKGRAEKIGRTFDNMKAYAELANECIDSVRECYAKLEQVGISTDVPLEIHPQEEDYQPGCKFNTDRFKIYNIS